ncbi:MAG: DUF3464 family protein [Cyanothece sp. SIO1E1]|nr:DUF3464 family protein [Cyanothece sp. SIO1E1]
MMSPEIERERLPFEPDSNRKKDKASTQTPVRKGSRNRRTQSDEQVQIPKAVSRRMLRRMSLFSGVPSAIGAAGLFASYYLTVNNVIKLPNELVLILSLSLFGVGFLGITYGALSAAWDEESPGSLLGLSEFKTNWGRMRASQRAAKEARQAEKTANEKS